MKDFQIIRLLCQKFSFKITSSMIRTKKSKVYLPGVKMTPNVKLLMKDRSEMQGEQVGMVVKNV
jgi:hypothetical protein